jgi:hypothetical protein
MSTTALASNDTNDATYTTIENRLLDITQQRNAIASQMLSMLEDSTFDGKAFNEAKAQGLINAAEGLLEETIGTEEARD